jgi:DNA-binding response OmpR family regulator
MKPTLILIVDDNPHISKLLAMNLEKEGFSVIHAANGEEGFEKVKKEKPDLVISDVMMPKLDGISLCQKIRTETDVSMVPFMFLTSIDADVTQKRGFRAGADQYLVKSEINREVLLAKVRDMLKHVSKINEIDAPQKGSFNGDLSELSLIEILQLLHINKKSGTLTIRRQYYPEASIHIKDGEIIHAQLGEDLDEKAMFIISVWKRGEFTFTQRDISQESRTIKTPTLNIILESCRLQETK